MTFDNLGLSSNILRAVASEGYKTPTDVQAQTIPVILKGNDVLAGAQTGTGKTAAFTLPMLELLKVKGQTTHKAKESKDTRDDKEPHKGKRANKPILKGLVLTPTRELAEQVEKSIRTYGKYIGVKSAAIYGGVHIGSQQRILRSGVDIVVATPGRLLDHVKQRSINLGSIEMFVLDEADRMLDMGFVEDINKITRLIPKKHQTLFFSATFSDDIKKLANTLLHEPENIEIAKHNTTNENVTQIVHPVSRSKKTKLLIDMIKQGNWKQTLIFTRTKKGADELSGRLKDAGIQAGAIHGDKPQMIRAKTLKSFKNNTIKILVATDVASRGIDIDRLSHVINYEIPTYAEDYVHRIGRTGRGGNKGEAISLVSQDEVKFLEAIEKLIKKSIDKVAVAGYEYELDMRDYADKEERPKRDNNRRRGNSRGRGRGGSGNRRGGSGGNRGNSEGRRDGSGNRRNNSSGGGNRGNSGSGNKRGSNGENRTRRNTNDNN
jgi:ATP-dependent RNA helicase RhlE